MRNEVCARYTCPGWRTEYALSSNPVKLSSTCPNKIPLGRTFPSNQALSIPNLSLRGRRPSYGGEQILQKQRKQLMYSSVSPVSSDASTGVCALVVAQPSVCTYPFFLEPLRAMLLSARSACRP